MLRTALGLQGATRGNARAGSDVVQPVPPGKTKTYVVVFSRRETEFMQ